MRYFLLLGMLLLAPVMVHAAEDEPTAVTLCGLCLPCACELQCVSMDICCHPCMAEASSGDPLIVEFIHDDGSVLATAELPGPWGDPCCNCTFRNAPLDHPVSPAAVRYVKISKPGEDDLLLNWFRLSAGYAVPCCCQQWFCLFDCCIPVCLGTIPGCDDAIILM